MIISFWNRQYRGSLLRLVFSRLCRLSGVGELVNIVDHIREWECSPFSGFSGKILVPWEIEVKPLYMGEGMGGRYGLAWTNVDFRELVVNWKLLGVDDPCQPHG